MPSKSAPKKHFSNQLSYRFSGCVATFLLLVLFLFAFSALATSPPASSLHRRTLTFSPLPIFLSPNPIAPVSLRIVSPLAPRHSEVRLSLDTSCTHLLVDAPTDLYGDTLTISYRTLAMPQSVEYNFDSLYFTHSPDSALLWMQQPAHLPYAFSRVQPPFTLTGYAERQVGVGQTTTSFTGGAIRLALHGTLPSGIQIEGQLSDQSLPFQPEGTTTQLQALDRVYLKLSDRSWLLEAGDLTLAARRMPFLVYNQQVQGLNFAYSDRLLTLDSAAAELSLGLAKGEFTRVVIRGEEGIQGPYRLQGQRDFVQVVVLAGSERVYLDGKLLTRGENRDYIIDYNLGEIRFTPRCPITARSRIIVEYERAIRSFIRYVASSSAALRTVNGWLVNIQGHTTHDASSSPLALADPDAARKALALVPPDELEVWVVPTTPAVWGEHSAGYLRQDTLIDGVTYTYFRYLEQGSADSLFLPPFSYVGKGKGDYTLRQGATNTQIFDWTPPKEGRQMGDYRVGQRVTPPQSHTVLQLSLGKKWAGDLASTSIDAAYSYCNRNTLAADSPNARHGLALHLQQENRLLSYGSDGLSLSVEGRYVGAKFTEVQTFLPVEFHRAWGVLAPSAPVEWGDALIALTSREQSGVSRLSFGGIARSDAHGLAGELHQQHRWGLWGYASDVSLRMVDYRDSRAQLGSGNLSVSRDLPYVRLTLLGRGEGSQRRGASPGGGHCPDAWWETGVRADLADTLRATLSIEATLRADAPSSGDAALPGQRALQTRLASSFAMPHHGKISALAALRCILSSPEQSAAKSPLSLLSQFQITQPFARMRFYVMAEHALSAERLPRWQQHFVRVPMGQGQYAWVDANGDGIAQMEEFVQAAFRDQGEYTLQYVPSSHGVHALTSQMRFNVRFTPRPNQRPITDSTVWWQRFDLEMQAHSSQKRNDARWGALHNPLPFSDSALLEQQGAVQATVHLNRDHSPIGLFYGFTLSHARQSLSQGVSLNYVRRHHLELSTPVRPGVGAGLEGEWCVRSQTLPYGGLPQLPTATLSGAALLHWRGASRLCHTLRVSLSHISHRVAPQRARLHRYSYTLRQPLSDRWHADLVLMYAHLTTTIPANNPLAYESLQGMMAGHNFLAELSLTCRITRYLELTTTYHARRLGSERLVQSGFLQLRAIL